MHIENNSKFNPTFHSGFYYHFVNETYYVMMSGLECLDKKYKIFGPPPISIVYRRQ